MATWNLNFTRIDNQVQVLFNGIQIYDSGVIDNNPVLDINVPLNCISGLNAVNVTLLNADGPPPAGNPWQIAYTVTDANGKTIANVTSGVPGSANPISGGAPVYVSGFCFNA